MSTTRKALFTLAALGLAALAAHPASAQTTITNLVLNGSFEMDNFQAFPGYSNYNGNGSITDWTASGPNAGLNPYTSGSNSDGTGPNPFANNGAVPDGKQVAFLQSVNNTTTLSQTIDLNIGQQYQVSFYDNARSGYAAPTLSLLVDGTSLYSQTLVPVNGNNAYNFVTESFIATKSSENLTFSSTGTGDATSLIDGVKVNASAAPEPAQIGVLALVALGLGALAVKARKRSAAA